MLQVSFIPVSFIFELQKNGKYWQNSTFLRHANSDVMYMASTNLLNRIQEVKHV